MEQSFLAERMKMEAAIKAAHAPVAQAHATVEANRRILRRPLESAIAAYAQAKADQHYLST